MTYLFSIYAYSANTRTPLGNYILQEHLGQQSIPSRSKLTSRELAFTHPQSEVIVSVRGRLDKVFDLTDLKNLALFISLTKKFELPARLEKQAKQLNLPESGIIQTPLELSNTLLMPEWRIFPAHMSVPSNPQVFGHLIYSAGVKGCQAWLIDLSVYQANN